MYTTFIHALCGRHKKRSVVAVLDIHTCILESSNSGVYSRMTVVLKKRSGGGSGGTRSKDDGE